MFDIFIFSDMFLDMSNHLANMFLDIINHMALSNVISSTMLIWT